jgi:protein TonB
VTLIKSLVAPPAIASPSAPPSGSTLKGQVPQRIRVSGNLQAANLINKVEPVYPPLAEHSGIEGTIRFNVIVDKEGHVANIQLVSGHPLLVEAAQDAVRQWVYKPTLLDGQPVEVATQIDITFTRH